MIDSWLALAVNDLIQKAEQERKPNRCGRVHPRAANLFCSLDKGHKGKHVALTGYGSCTWDGREWDQSRRRSKKPSA